MKRSFYALLCAMLMSCALLFVACGDKDKETPTPVDTTPPHTHSWVEATCTTAKKCSTCAITEGTALGHDERDVEATEATCTEDGMSAGKRCFRCQLYTVRPTLVTSALGHTDANGDKKCDVCGENVCNHTFDYTEAGREHGNNTHWYKATCGCDVKGGEDTHTYDEWGIECIVCKYDTEKEGHTHELSDEWSYNAAEHWHAAICGHEEERELGEAHEDADSNDYCDICNVLMLPEYDITAKYATYNWDNTKLVFCFNEDSNNQELSSELRRYLAGDTSEKDVVDDMVAQRNANALAATNVTIDYMYWGEHDSDYENYHWGLTTTKMIETVMAAAPNSPDVYVNQMYDMISASLQKAFANVRTTQLSGGDNNFSFMESEFKAYSETYGEEFGYMMEYMSELGFSINKQYVIASDYLIDLVRAFFVVPLNINLLNTIDLDQSTGDRDGDGDFDTDDFYDMVMSGGWTYDTLIQYSSAVYRNTSGVIGGSIDDTNGFILINNGLYTSGIVYTSSVVIFERELNEATGYYDCTYPSKNDELYAFYDAVAKMVSSVGVQVASVSHTTVRDKFTSQKVLFGGIILLGSLEYSAYQDMKSNGGFGILPVPVYRQGDSYRTLIHNMGRIAAIAANTKNFAQCSAYLDYQSTHSSDVLEEYYDYKLQMDIAGGTKGNIEILKYIRKNVRSGFDKAYEDAIGFYFKEGNSGQSWAGLLQKNNYKVASIRELYVSNSTYRSQALADIVAAYPGLPE